MYNILTLESWTGHNDKTLTDDRDSKTPQNNPESCTWLLDLHCPLCSGQQLDVSVAIIRSANTGQYLHFIMLNKLYTCSAKCQISDLTNLVSKPRQVLPQINTPLPLTQQAPGSAASPQFHSGLQANYCIVVIQGKCGGNVGELMCVSACDLGKSR